jgi:O-antigen ligase
VIISRSLKNLLLLSVAMLVAIPIGFNIGQLSGKPLVIFFSDFLALISLFFLFKLRNPYVFKLFFLLIIIFIVFLISNMFAIASNVVGSQTAALSFVREFRAFPIVFLGAYIQNRYHYSFEKQFSFVLFVVPFLLIASDIMLKQNWPYGRWGGHFLGFDILGFPNTVGILYVMLFALCLSKAIMFGGKWIVPSLLWLFIITLLGSRIVLAASFFVFISMLLFKIQKSLKLLALLVIILMVAAATLDISQLFNIYISKFTRIFTEGVLGARAEIFHELLSAIYQRPLLGHGYAPVAGYLSEFSSAHNQYLNIIFRVGLVGMIVFALFWGYIFSVFWKLKGSYKALLFGFLGCLIGGFTQATFGYNGVSTFLFFFFGVAAESLQSSKNNRGSIIENS